MSRRDAHHYDSQDSISNNGSDRSGRSSDHHNNADERIINSDKLLGSRSRDREYVRRYRSRSRSRSPIRERERVHVANRRNIYYSSDSDASDQGFDFIIPRSSASTFSQETTLASLETKEATVTQIKLPTPGLHTLSPEVSYNTLQAQYVGEGTLGGEHLASLTVVKDLRLNPYSLYRWVHYFDPEMRFEQFRNAVISLPELTDSERSSVAKLLRHVREKFDRPYRASTSVKARMMIPGVLQEEIHLTNETKQIQSGSRTITWMCVPYFSLDKYSDTSVLDDGAHPMRTLVQARYALVDRKRDMQQAVCNLPNSESGFCFHVPQVWYIVLGASVIFTCAPLRVEDLQGHNIPLSIISSPDPYKDEAQKLLISFGSSVLWSFRLEDCDTWFALMTKFSEFPLHFRFLYRARVITSKLWPRIISQAKHSPGNLMIDFDLRARRTPQIRGILRKRGNASITGMDSVQEPQHEDGVGNGPPSTIRPSHSENQEAMSTSLNNDFHVLTWLNMLGNQNSVTTMGINTAQLADNLKAMDDFLRDQTNLVQSLAYKECEPSAHLPVLDHLQKEASSVSASTSANSMGAKDKARNRHAMKVDIFNAAESVFEFFMPVTIKGATVDKFWGAVHCILGFSPGQQRMDIDTSRTAKPKSKKVIQFDDNEYLDLREDLESITQQMQPLKDLLSQAPLTERAKIKIPDELVKAWLHIVMMLVFAAHERDNWSWRAQSRKVVKLLTEGSKIVLQGFVQRSLLKDSVVMPQEIATLTSMKLLNGWNSGAVKRSITETYLEYLNKLELEVEAKPFDREHQDKILRLQEEIAVILQHLGWQRTIFQAIRMSVDQQQYSTPSRKYHDDPYRREAEAKEKLERLAALEERQIRDKSLYTSKVVSFNPGRPSYHTAVARNSASAVDLEELTKIAPTDEKGYRDLLLQDCIDLAERQIREFEEMRIKADELRTYNIRRIDKNKDRHENAIYAFTVVTIVFLPLSTVASILGMNTNDIRNMDVNQWVFWTVAIPVLVGVLFLCLVWTGELSNFWTGFKSLWQRKTSPQIRDRHDGHKTSYDVRERARHYERYSSDSEDDIYVRRRPQRSRTNRDRLFV